MKKAILSILIICLVISSTLVLASCGHECEFSTEWSHDASSHWHACTHEGCEEVSEKTAHSWNEGEITTDATQEAEGVKTFTCTVCTQTKTEPVAFTGMSEAQWDAVFDESVFENITCVVTSTVKATDIEMSYKITQKYTKDAAYAKIEMAGQSEEEFGDAEDSANGRASMLESLRELARYEDYEYDAENKLYNLTGETFSSDYEVDVDSATVKFENGRLAEIKFTAKTVESNIEMDVTVTYVFSDYGTTVIEQK